MNRASSHVGTLDVTPQQSGGAEDEQSGDDPGGAQPFGGHGLDEGEDRGQEKAEPPGEADQEAASEHQEVRSSIKARAFPSADRARPG